jgi:hypothetical protein
MEFVQAHLNAKRITLLATLTHTDFVDSPNSRRKWLSSETLSSNIQRPISVIGTLEERSDAIITPSSNRLANLLRCQTQTNALGFFLPQFTIGLLRQLPSTSPTEIR